MYTSLLFNNISTMIYDNLVILVLQIISHNNFPFYLLLIIPSFITKDGNCIFLRRDDR
jgi:hypothetical protein